jgi:hypothetical protein
VLPRDISGGRLYSYERGSGGPTFMTAHGIHDTDMSYHRTFLDRKKEFHWPSKYLPRDFPSCSVLAAKFHLPKTGQDMIGSLKGEAGGWLHALAEWQENCGESLRILFPFLCNSVPHSYSHSHSEVRMLAKGVFAPN